jgi:hypothetical protein
VDTNDLKESEVQIIKILRALKPYERIEIMADGEGRTETYIISQSSKRMILGGKQVFMQIRTGARVTD